MDLLLKSAHIVDPNSSHNGKKRDILIKNGVIEKIESSISAKVKTIEASNLFASPGWFDLKVNFCEPGYEFKEDLKSGIEAARSGGYVGAAHSPFLKPIISNRGQVEYLRSRAKEYSFDLRPIGSLTYDAKGEVISEMFDMHQGGACAYSDFRNEVGSGIMLKALQYVTSFDGLIISMPIDHSIAGNAFVHEGKNSASIGSKGIPDMAEEIRIMRDLELLAYSKSKLHFSGVSSQKGVALIRKAKIAGANVTADVYLHNLVFNDESILEFDSNKKIFPPARSETDRIALMKALIDDTIDAVVSDHSPENLERKEVEIEYASFGIAAIESLYSVLNDIGLDREMIIKKIALAPREILGVDPVTVEVGSYASLTLFQEGKEYKPTKENRRSRSNNDPYLNKVYSNKVMGTVVGNHVFLNS